MSDDYPSLLSGPGLQELIDEMARDDRARLQLLEVRDQQILASWVEAGAGELSLRQLDALHRVDGGSIYLREARIRMHQRWQPPPFWRASSQQPTADSQGAAP